MCNRVAVARIAKLARVVKDYAEGVALAHAQGADTMANIDAIVSTRPAHRTVAIGEDDALALVHRNGYATRLRARSLLDEQKFAALEIAIAPAQHAGELKRKCDIAIQILM